MKLTKKLHLFVLPLLLLNACKKEKFETTGTLVVKFQNGVPSCYSIYTEGITDYPLYTSGGGRPADIKVKVQDNTVTFEGLNYGNYRLNTCPYGNVLIVQVVAGETRTYPF